MAWSMLDISHCDSCLSKSFSSVKGEWTKVQEWLQANAENKYVAGTSDRDAHAMICGKLLRGDYPSFKTEKRYLNIGCQDQQCCYLSLWTEAFV